MRAVDSPGFGLRQQWPQRIEIAGNEDNIRVMDRNNTFKNNNMLAPIRLSYQMNTPAPSSSINRVGPWLSYKPQVDPIGRGYGARWAFFLRGEVQYWASTFCLSVIHMYLYAR